MKIVAFCCEQSALGAIEEAAARQLQEVASLELHKVPCSGAIEIISLLKSLEDGADRVLVLACHDDACQYLWGNKRCEKRINYARQLLRKTGLDDSRLIMKRISNVQVMDLVNIIKEITNDQHIKNV
jgi:coenzyme F420-reducing hydrogenase delta subunit